MEKIRSMFEPQSIYELILRPLHHSKVEHMTKALDNIIKNQGDNQAAEGPHYLQVDNDRFFYRRKLEFDLLRSHIDVVHQAVKDQPKVNPTEVPMAHIFSDMRNFNLEPEQPSVVDYHSKATLQPLTENVTGRGVRSSVNKYPRPYVNQNDSEINIAGDSDRSSPQNQSPISAKNLKIGLRAFSDYPMTITPSYEILASPLPDKDQSFWRVSSKLNLGFDLDPHQSLLDNQVVQNNSAKDNHQRQDSYAQGVNSEQKVSVSYLHLLRSYLQHSNSYLQIKQENQPEDSFNLASVDFGEFMDKYLGNYREYTYKNWNHFSKRGQLKFDHSPLRPKTSVSDMDFTELEKDWKRYAEKLPIQRLARSACLDYQYNPEYCFNSMIDVIHFGKVLTRLDSKNKSELDRPKRMVYAPRVFNDPQDSLYQEGEFPPTHKNVFHILGQWDKSYTMQEVNAACNSQKARKIKQQIYRTSRSLIKKDFFPISQKELSQFNRTLKADGENKEFPLRKNSFRQKNRTMSKGDFSSLPSISDKYLADFVEVDIKHADSRLQLPSSNLPMINFSSSSGSSSDLDPEEWFEGIINQEKPKDNIAQMNWSGEQIRASSRFTKHKMEVTIDSLNLQDLEIWLTGWSGFSKMVRKNLRNVMGHRYTDRALMICVILNTVFLALEGLVDSRTDEIFANFNVCFTLIFLVAYLLSLWGFGWAFLQSYFNVFDGSVIVVSVIELAINFSNNDVPNGSAISAFRAIRILRIFKVLRLTRVLRSLKFIVVIITVITETVEQYLYVAIMLLLFLLIYALLGMQIYAGKLPPQIVMPRANYDTFIGSFVTVLQLVTFENWTDHIVLLNNTGVHKAVTLLFVLSWLVLGNYVFLNLFLALLLGGFENEEVIKSLQETKDEFKELKEQIKKENLERKRFVQELEDKRVRESRNINYIIYTDIKQQIYEDEAMFDVLTQDKLKTRGVYYLERPFKHDESSLEDLLYETLKEATSETLIKRQATIKKKEIYLEVLILVSSLKLVAETYVPPGSDPKLSLGFTIFDNFITILFMIEAFLKIVRNGLMQCRNSYFKDPWSIVDFVIVVASFIDMVLAGVSIPMIKVIRALRPLRFVAKYRHMKIVVNSLGRIVVPLLNVFIVIFIVWLIFSILGMNFLSGKLYYCDINFYFDVSKEVCLSQGYEWKRAYWNFDNIGESLVTLFVLSNLEGWPSLVVSAIDAGDTETSGPHYNNYPYMWFYYMGFIFVSSFFLIDLMIGIIFYHYGEELEKAISTDCIKATPDQTKWIMTQKLIFSAKSNFKIQRYPKSRIRRFFFVVMTSRAYELAMFVAILLNIVVLAMDYVGMSETYENTLDNISDFFSWLFLLELICKLVAHGKYYFKDRWNIFDCFIAVLSMVDVFIGLYYGGSSGGIQRIQFAKSLRVIRIVRLIKLFKHPKMAAFNKLINTLIFSLPTIFNVLALLLLTYSIFAVLACFIFRNSSTVNPTFYNENVNFDNFHMAMLTLFRCSTGEDWPSLMYNYGDSDGNYVAARIFFLTFIFVVSIVLLNLLDLVVVSIFENFYFDPDSVLSNFDQTVQTFNEAWNAFTFRSKGMSMSVLTLPRFFASLPEPLGFRVVADESAEIPVATLVSSQQSFYLRRPISAIGMLLAAGDLPVDHCGRVSYSPVLQQALKFMIGLRSLRESSYEAFCFVRRLETGMIADRILRDAKKRGQSLVVKTLQANKQKFNIVRAMINMRLALMVWKEYNRLWQFFTSRKPTITTEDLVDKIGRKRDHESATYLQSLRTSNKKKKGQHKQKGTSDLELLHLPSRLNLPANNKFGRSHSMTQMKSVLSDLLKYKHLNNKTDADLEAIIASPVAASLLFFP